MDLWKPHVLPLTSRLVGFLESGWGISLILLANPQELEGTHFDPHLFDLVIGPYHTPRALCSAALSWFPSLSLFLPPALGKQPRAYFCLPGG